VGLLSFGGFPIWIFLFPLTMVATIRMIQRWGWLSPAFNTEQRRRGLQSVYVALVFPLFLPWIQLPAILFAVLVSPLVMLYARLKGGMSGRAQGDLGMAIGVAASMILLAFFYCFFQARGLRRFTGVRHRTLTIALVVLILTLIFIGGLLGNSINWSSGRGSPLEPAWAVLAVWFTTVLALRWAGAVFGAWLTRSDIFQN
jgi:hypothetical protein